jgi:hypothetical protein
MTCFPWVLIVGFLSAFNLLLVAPEWLDGSRSRALVRLFLGIGLARMAFELAK